MPSQREYLELLSQPIRWLIYNTLVDHRGVHVTHLSELTGLSEVTVSYHLRLLREAGIVVRVKQGTFAIYSPNLLVLDQIILMLQTLRKDYLNEAQRNDQPATEGATLWDLRERQDRPSDNPG